MRTFFITCICFIIFCGIVNAQKRDTVFYFLTKNFKPVSVQDSADFVRFICPADSADGNLHTVKDFYTNGKPKLLTKSSSDNMYLVEEGVCIEFYKNGKRKSISNYEKGIPTGEETDYYPNGKLHKVVSYINHQIFLNEFRDSTGKAMTENGNGTWTKFDDDFNFLASGPVKDGKPDGEWSGKIINGKKQSGIYKNGKFISGDDVNIDPRRVFTAVDIAPHFPGGDAAFGQFLGRNIRYPSAARINNVQGRVIITFVVEKDGSLSDIKVVRGIGSGADEEALRALRLSPLWVPGMQNGHPVRVQYSVPVQFALDVKNR